MTTIEDVIELAGVSTATVSRVINQTAWIEPMTYERTEKAVCELNYHRDTAAITSAKRSGDMLGLLIGNLADPFFVRLARGVEEISRRQQFRLMVYDGGHDEGMEKSELDFLVNQDCEATVVHVSRLFEKELPRYTVYFPVMVVVNRYIAGMANRYVWLESSQAAGTATLHLLEQGYHYIAYVTSDLPIIDRSERLEDYRQVLAKHGITPDRNWVINVSFNGEGGERATYQLLNYDIPFITAVTFNDIITAGIMRILRQRGITFPQQLSIVGFDDVVIAHYLYPTLTTMRYPTERMAHSASQLAIQLLKGATQRPSVNSFTADSVIRDSVPPPSLQNRCVNRQAPEL